MSLPRLSLATRLSLWGAAAVALPTGVFALSGSTAYSACVAAMSALALRWIVGRQLAPLTGLHERLLRVSAETKRQEQLIETQNKLFDVMSMLRKRLYAYGDPKKTEDRLYFGTTLINGNFDVVDAVKEAAGGVATIFLDDLRISTNVTKPDQSRAVNTKLAQGPAYQSIFKNGKTYSGEAEILGSPYLAVYEPIVSDEKVIGILFAGVRKEDAGAAQVRSKTTDTFTDMGLSVDFFEEAVIAKGKAELYAGEQRYLGEAAHRQTEALRKVTADNQKVVVDALLIALEQLSSGNLLHDINEVFPSDYMKLKQDFNAAMAKLRKTMVNIRDTSVTICENSGEISHSAVDLSSRTERQAASLEQTAAALNELTSRVKETSAGAQKARSLVSVTRSSAERSGEVVRNAMAAMAAIDESAKAIAQVIGVIDEIAFQTSLLALNAGVEAARAGDAGRGFAVVASEVRGLAQRSADASKEVRKLIMSSAAHVGTGVGLVTETSEALHGIVHDVAEISSIVETIAAAARDQATGLQEVNLAINEMDRVTQQNAAMVEESTAACQTLTSMAEDLSSQVDRFQIGRGETSRGQDAAVGRRRAA